MFACKHVFAFSCVCVHACVEPSACVSVLVKQSVSVLTAMSHAGDQSQGDPAIRTTDYPLCMIPIFIPRNCDSCAVSVTYFAERLLCSRCRGSGGALEKKKKVFKVT